MRSRTWRVQQAKTAHRFLALLTEAGIRCVIDYETDLETWGFLRSLIQKLSGAWDPTSSCLNLGVLIQAKQEFEYGCEFSDKV